MTFLFDEHFSPRLVYILKFLFVRAVHITEVFHKGTKDAQFLPYLKEKGYVLVTCDKRMRTRPPEAIAYKASEVMAIFVAGFFAEMIGWEQAIWLVRNWRAIEAYATKMAPGTPIRVNRGGTARYIFTSNQKRFKQTTL